MFWWDIPEYSGREDIEVDASKPPRPDGKIIFKHGDDTNIFLIEITIPWTANRQDKLAFKETKYKDIMQNLKLENPGSKVDQITLVMDVFGSYNAGHCDKEHAKMCSV